MSDDTPMDQGAFQKAVLDRLDKLVSAADPVVKAYDRPVLDVKDVTVDGVTVNQDGSIWAMSAGFSPGGSSVQVPKQMAFGYISPKKTPEIWQFLERNMTPEAFAAWKAEWEAHPYSIYGADLRGMIANGSLNIITFHMIFVPLREYVQ